MSYFITLIFFLVIAKDVLELRDAVFYACLLFILMTYFIFVINSKSPVIFSLTIFHRSPSCRFCTLPGPEAKVAIAFSRICDGDGKSRNDIPHHSFRFGAIIHWIGRSAGQGLAVTIALAFIWLAVKAALMHFVKGGVSDADLEGVAAFKLVFNLETLLKPWQWPAVFPLAAPVALTAYFLSKRPSRGALDWIAPYLGGFALLVIVAQVIELRAFGDLIGFATMSIIFFLLERGIVLLREPQGVSTGMRA